MSTKYRSITEKVYIEGYRAARIERRSYVNDYWINHDRWQHTSYEKAFTAARRHLWQHIHYEYHSAWWTPARARYEVWREKKRHGGTIPF